MHGFNPLGLRALKDIVDRKARAKVDPRRGFRNLFGSSAVLFSGDGLLQEPDGDRILTELMKKLTRQRSEPPDHFWSDTLPAPAAEASELKTWENPAIPSGYTYLLQLVAHDLVASTVSLSTIIGRSAVDNARDNALILDTIYGDGPELTPDPYEVDTEHHFSRGLVPRTRLRLSPPRPRVPGATFCPHRDLGRGTGTAGLANGKPIFLVEDEEQDTDNPKPYPTDTMIADERNDSHALLSQLVVLFHLLHNTVIKTLQDRPPHNPQGWSQAERAWRRFLCARLAVTLIYRKIVRDDLLRRILHEKVYAAYTNDGLRLDKGEGIPLEFSHGAFRFGHAMVRDSYRINDPSKAPLLTDFALRQARRFPFELPVSQDWLIDWRLFFEVEQGTAPNYSRRIGPDYGRVMFSDLMFTSEPGLGLPFLDHLSAAHAGIWSVPRLFERLAKALPNSSLAHFFSTYEFWRAPFLSWLGESDSTGRLSETDKRRLANDPPLSLFVLFEAAHTIKDGAPVRDGGGARLGPLGSIIVAETIFGALDQKIEFENASTLSEALRNCGGELLDDPAALDDVAVGAGADRREIGEMKDVILFLAAKGKFAA